jgi:hypothetical protein
MKKRTLVELSDISPETRALGESMMFDAVRDQNLDIVDKRFEVKMIVEAGDARMEYITGDSIGPEFIKDYDLFNKIRSTVIFRYFGAELESVVIEDEY